MSPTNAMETVTAQLIPQLSEVFDRADAATRVGDFTVARELYTSVFDVEPDNEDARAGLVFLDYLEGGRKSRFNFPIEPISTEVYDARLANQRLNEQEFETRKTRLESYPSQFHIEHTTRCNFYCPHCSKGYDPYFASDAPQEAVDKLLNEYLPLARYANITGFGEPTIGSQYLPLLKRLASLGVSPQFNTNISTLNVGHIELLVRCVSHITLSIDGGSKVTFEMIRKGGNWDRTLDVLAQIKRVRAVYQTPGFWGITFVAMRVNIHELPDMIRLTRRYNLDRLLVQDYQPFGTPFDDQTLRHEPERANRIFREGQALADELGVSLMLPPEYSLDSTPPGGSVLKKIMSSKRLFPARKRFSQRCALPWNSLTMKVDGSVTPCCFSLRPMGNLKKGSPESIWNGLRYRIFRKRVDSFYPPPECRICHVYEGINQGNPGNTMAREGLLLKILYRIENRLGRWIESRRKVEEQPNYFEGKSLRPADAPSPRN